MGALKEEIMELLQEIKEEVLKEKVLRRVVSVAIALALIITSIPPFTAIAQANPLGLVIGSSYTISSDGYKLSSAGLIDISEVIFEIGINRDPKMAINKNGDLTKVVDNYQTILPVNMNNTILFMTPTLYNQIKSRWGKFVLGYYVPSSKTFQCAADQSALYRVKVMQNISSPPSSYTNGKYYNKLKSNYDPNTISTLANRNWGALLDGDGTAGVQFWSYVLKPQVSGDWATWDIKGKLDSYFTKNTSIKTFDLNKIDDWSPADKWEIKLRYLDLLLMTYEAVPREATKFKSAWAAAIDDYIAGIGLDTKPVTLVITPDVAINPGSPIVEKTGAVIVRTPDFLNYAAGVEAKFFTLSEIFVNIPNDDTVLSYTPETPGDTTRTYNTYTYAVKQSIAMSPNFKRITDALDPSNAFSWGYGAMAKYRLSTSGGKVQWKSTSVQASYLDVMQIKHPQQTSNIKKTVSGFLMIPAPPLAPLSLKIQLSATPDYLIQGGATLGTVNKLDVTCVPDPKVLAAWKPYIDAAKAQGKNFSVKLKIQRTYDQGGYAPNYSPTDIIDPNYRVLTADQFLELLNGNMTLSIIDDVSVYPSKTTPGGYPTIHRFIYTVTMTVTYNSGQPNPPSASAVATDMASIVVYDANNNDIMKYTSSPDAWAELKQGKPYDEDFDAMAGVPTTETLYFGAGGSEFIVQVQLRYVADEKATRTYKVHYDGGVECEFKNGDTAKFPSGEHSSYEERDFVSGSRQGCGNYAPPPSPKPKSYSWTAASDGKTRSTTEKYQLVSRTWTDHYYETKVDKDGKTYQEHVTSKCTSHWEYYYKYWVDAHEICGPCCQHILPEVNDTWTQTITYDYIKIDDVHVWRIDQASINGMVEIVDKYTQDNDIIFKDGDVIIKAKIKQGTPNIFYNIGEEKAKREGFQYDEKHRSLAGRIRYTIEPQQHDEVVYNMGPRSNKCDGMGKTVSGNKIPSGGQGHQHPWATGILYNNTGYPNEVDYHRQKTSVKTAYSNIADAKDTQTQEWKVFDQFRKMQNTATVISDMLILQTSSGDQSVIYFEKKSNTVRSDQNFNPVKATKEEMWDNNPLSAAKWDEKAINVGSYNGKWNSPNKKYDGTGDKKQIKTIFDSAPGGKDPASVSSQYKAAYNYLTRPSRPSQLFLYKDNIKQQIDNINKSYITGEAEVFWEHILSYPSTATALYDTTSKSLYNKKGYVQKAPYSPEHAKVNDIVVHNPVSTEDAVVIGLDDSRDQRSTMPLGSAEDTINEANRLTVCPRDPALCEFRVQNCTYFKDVLLAFFDFENGAVNQVTGKSYTLPSGFTIENVNRFGTGKSLSAKGVRWEIPFADLYNPAEGLTKGLQYNPGLPIYVEADFYVPVPATSGTMLVSFYRYDLYLPTGSTTPTWNTGHGWERRANVDITNKNIKIGMQFDMTNLDRSKLFINGSEVTNYTRINSSDLITADLVGDKLNIGSWGANDSYPANFYLDNLKIIRKAGTTQHNESCYRTFMMHPDGFNAHVHSADCINNTSVDVIASLLQGTYVGGSSGSQEFGYTGSIQVFTAPVTGTYTLEVWGAEGGSYVNNGGKGGYSRGTVQLTAGQTIYVVVGGKGGDGSSDYRNPGKGGYNGGGTGGRAGQGASGSGGGGATHIATRSGLLSSLSAYKSDVLIVAGGGGGAGSYSGGDRHGGYGGGETGGKTGSDSTTLGRGGGGGTQTAGGATSNSVYTGQAGSFGKGGDGYAGSSGGYGGGGGGGGWYGGGSGGTGNNTTSCGGGGGGSGYIGGVENGVTIPGNQPMPSPSGGTQVGHSGHGYARISWNIPGEHRVDWSTIKSLLGPAFQAIFNPNVIYNMTFGDGNLKGFTALHNCTLSVSGGQLVFNITGSDPQCELPVDIEAPAVMQIRITFDNNSSGTQGQLYFKKENGTYNETDSIKWNMQANKAGQVVTLDISDVPSWSGKITGLRFDFSNASSGNVRVTKIEFIGFGTASGASGSGQVWNFGYTGNVQIWTAPYSGKYKLETWGAQGGSNGAEGGKGGYASGEINLTAGQKLYIFVGGKGGDGRNDTYDGGYNGGGYGYGYGGGGGGMTFISTSPSATAAPSNQARNGGSWNSTGVVIVAGGGGGAGSRNAPGGHGGGLTGGDGAGRYGSPGYGGTQTSGGSGGSNYGTSGGHGYGGSNTAGYNSGGGGGGGGWYGGGGGGNDYSRYDDNDDSGGGGGSGYIGGVQNGVLIPGNQSMPAPGGGNQTGQSGHGYARITLLSDALKITYKPPINDTAILIEESTTNIFPHSTSFEECSGTHVGNPSNPNSISTNIGGGWRIATHYNSSTIKVSTDGGRFGSKRISFVHDGSSGWKGAVSNSWSIKKGVTYTVTVWARANKASNKSFSRGYAFYNSSGQQYQFTWPDGYPTQKPGVWVRGICTFTATADESGATYLYGLNEGENGLIVDYDGLQVEEKGYATTYIEGTRQAENLTIPTSGVLSNSGPWTIECWAKTNHSGKSYRMPFAAWNKFYVALNPEDKPMISWVDSSGIQRSAVASKAIDNPTGWHHWAFTWDGSVSRLYIDGVKVVEASTNLPKTLPTYLTIGSIGNNYYWNGLIDELRISNIVRSDTEIANTAKSYKSIPKDSYTKYKMNFNGTLTPEVGSSPTFTRNSLAYLYNGGYVTANVPRYALNALPLVDLLRNNYSLIPDKLPDGTDNFIWGCGGKPYNIHICNQNCREEIKLMCSEPHHNGLHYDGSNDICWDACNVDANHAFYKPKVITPTGEEIPNGKFINIDWPFRVYFPNIGDFYQGGKLGFSSVTTTRGKGYTDNMDTTKWTRAKRIRFDFNVIYIDPITGEETLYRAGEWIELPVATQVERIERDSEGNPVPIYKQGTGISYYDFYCVLANREAKSARIEYEVEAINSLGENDNKIAETNRKRYSDYTALHGGYKNSYIDVVGRIGNFVISDTDDYRFSNFFKVPVSNNEWLIDGIVKKVQPDVQNLYIGWKKDIRGVQVSASTHWFDTYGTQKWLDKAPVPFPLSPDKNNIPILRTQPLRPGYDILASIATIGNYARTRLQVVPYYYAMNLTNGTITPVDAYMNVNGKYLPINIYDLVKPGWDSSQVYPYVLNLDWVEEAPRRNYDMTEKAQTDALADLYAELVMTPDASGELQVTGRRELDRPVGRHYNLGTAQLMTPGGKARTFIGSEYTYGKHMNIGNKIQAEDWWYAAQRWHLKFGLPSSTVFVEHGKPVTPEEIAKIANADTVVLLSVDIQAVGDTFVLRYTHEGDNGSITVNGKTFVLPPNIPPVVAVFSANRTAAQDVDIRSTH